MTVLSTADFDAAVWTNKQYIASLLAQEFDVQYVESLGLRTPRLNSADVRRALLKLTSRPIKNRKREKPPRLEVVRPRVIPLHEISAVRVANRALLNNQLRRQSDHRTRALWTFSPLTYGLEESHDALIYHSVDLLHELPGVPGDLLLKAERSLLKRADIVIASSVGVERHLREHGATDVLLWENVADVERYIKPKPSRSARAIFAGNLTPTKIDTGAIEAVADTGVEVILAGPAQIDGSGTNADLKRLFAHRNIRYVGNLGPDELAAAMTTCTVGLIPYRLNSYTDGVFPMKVFEYLAAGLTVIATPLPSLVERVAPIPWVYAVPSGSFPSTVQAHLAVDDKGIAERREVAGSHSWTARGRAARRLVHDLG